jgi:hypothetical protein
VAHSINHTIGDTDSDARYAVIKKQRLSSLNVSFLLAIITARWHEFVRQLLKANYGGFSSTGTERDLDIPSYQSRNYLD